MAMLYEPLCILAALLGASSPDKEWNELYQPQIWCYHTAVVEIWLLLQCTNDVVGMLECVYC
jgi:hypothetical protein